MSKCKSCGAEIKWIKTKSGRAMPVDPECHSMFRCDGSAVLITEDGEVIKGELCSFEQGANATGYFSHFATCPNADSHRRR